MGMWDKTIEQLAGELSGSVSTKEMRFVVALTTVLQAKVAIQVAESETEAMKGLIAETRRLVGWTKYLAIATFSIVLVTVGIALFA